MPYSLSDDSFFNKTRRKASNAKNATSNYFKNHWIDYVLLFLILLLLGAFDIFILKKSDNFLSLNYWLHSVTRLGAYTLATILGIRIAYPKFKEACLDLQQALKWNAELLLTRGENFGDFINNINIETKKEAWRASINKRLARLDRISPDFFPLYYDSADEKGVRSEKFFEGIKLKWLKNKIKSKAEKYCKLRANLESLIKEDFITKNIHKLNVKYFVIYKHDFDNVEGVQINNVSYKTRTETQQAKTRTVINGLLVTTIIIFLMGSISLDIDKALAEEKVVGIASAAINGIIDVGLTLWKCVSGALSSEKIVRQEDLRVVVDKNEILVKYCKKNNIVAPECPKIQFSVNSDEKKEIKEETINEENNC